MIHIDKYAYMSKLNKKDPMYKFVVCMMTLAVCLWASSIFVSITVLLMMGWYTVYKGGIPLALFLKLLAIPMSFLVIGVLTIAIGISEQQNVFLLYISAFGMNIGVSQAGIQNAVYLFFKALGAVSCLYYLSLSTPVVDLLAVLRKLKVPKLMIELMGLVYRFIFILIETADTIFIAQKSRLGYSNLFSAYKSLASLISTLFIRAYKKSDELYTALEARGYDGELDVLEKSFKAHWSEYFFPVGINLFLVLVALFLK
ncbi:MAG: cobalt ECF transporter T component CbiQ [Thermoactinomyces sp.]